MKGTNLILALSSFVVVALGSALTQTTTVPASSANVAVGSACKEGSAQCSGGSPGGAVFICKNGAWDVLTECRSYESCYNNPVPHCTWASADAEMVPVVEEASAEASPNIKEATDVESPEGLTAGHGDGYISICTPCIRHFDSCRDSCAWQGKDCDAMCNYKTCTVNLLTNDIRQPIVECGSFCKWPCH